MKLIRCILVLFCTAVFSADAGVVVFNNGTAILTQSQTEKDGQLSVKTAQGEAVFTLDQIAWQSPTADSFLAAAQAAEKEGKGNVALILARESFLFEPANAAEAKQLAVANEPKPAPVTTAAAGGTAGGFSPAGAGSTSAGQTIAAGQPAVMDASQSAPPEETEPPEVGAHGWPVENAISAEDLRVNAIVIGVFGLVVLFTVWKMTVSEA